MVTVAVPLGVRTAVCAGSTCVPCRAVIVALPVGRLPIVKEPVLGELAEKTRLPTCTVISADSTRVRGQVALPTELAAKT